MAHPGLWISVQTPYDFTGLVRLVKCSVPTAFWPRPQHCFSILEEWKQGKQKAKKWRILQGRTICWGPDASMWQWAKPNHDMTSDILRPKLHALALSQIVFHFLPFYIWDVHFKLKCSPKFQRFANARLQRLQWEVTMKESYLNSHPINCIVIKSLSDGSPPQHSPLIIATPVGLKHLKLLQCWYASKFQMNKCRRNTWPLLMHIQHQIKAETHHASKIRNAYSKDKFSTKLSITIPTYWNSIVSAKRSPTV